MNLLTAALDLLLPQPCAGCGEPGGLLCRACEDQLARPAKLCFPSPLPAGLPPPFAVAPYAGPVRQLIIAHKERGSSGLAPPLGAALARAAMTAAAGVPVLLVPVPSSRASVRRRGHDPTLRIAEEAVSQATRARYERGARDPTGGLRVACVRALRHRRRVADQAGLTATDRAANLAGALQATLDLNGHRVIVVDDVVTTGATLTEAARALRAAGAEVPACAVIAATERHSAQPPTTTHSTAHGPPPTPADGHPRPPNTGRRPRAMNEPAAFRPGIGLGLRATRPARAG